MKETTHLDGCVRRALAYACWNADRFALEYASTRDVMYGLIRQEREFGYGLLHRLGFETDRMRRIEAALCAHAEPWSAVGVADYLPVWLKPAVGLDKSMLRAVSEASALSKLQGRCAVSPAELMMALLISGEPAVAPLAADLGLDPGRLLDILGVNQASRRAVGATQDAGVLSNTAIFGKGDIAMLDERVPFPGCFPETAPSVHWAVLTARRARRPAAAVDAWRALGPELIAGVGFGPVRNPGLSRVEGMLIRAAEVSRTRNHFVLLGPHRVGFDLITALARAVDLATGIGARVVGVDMLVLALLEAGRAYVPDAERVVGEAIEARRRAITSAAGRPSTDLPRMGPRAPSCIDGDELYELLFARSTGRLRAMLKLGARWAVPRRYR
jgi:hypothetical protein